MSLYPTLEDLHVEDILTAQEQAELKAQRNEILKDNKKASHFVKTEGDFLGCPMRHYLDEKGSVVFSEPVSEPDDLLIPKNKKLGESNPLDHDSNHTTVRAEVYPELNNYDAKTGIRRVMLSKDKNGKLGIQTRSLDSGVFISFVLVDSPAAKAGVKFGDQILELNDNYLAGKTDSEIGKLIKKAPDTYIPVILRARPFERTAILTKDASGKLGMTLKNGTIIEVLPNSNAAREGVLTNQQIVELDGMNVIGLDDKTLLHMMDTMREKVKITTMPKTLFQILIKKLGTSQIKREMDRSVPEF